MIELKDREYILTAYAELVNLQGALTDLGRTIVKRLWASGRV